MLSVTSLPFAFAPSAPVLVVARFLQGVGAAASWAGAFGWLVGAAPRERRGGVIGSALGAGGARAPLGAGPRAGAPAARPGGGLHGRPAPPPGGAPPGP